MNEVSVNMLVLTLYTVSGVIENYCMQPQLHELSKL